MLPLPCAFIIHQGRKFVKAFFLGSFIRFLQLTVLLYIKGKILSSNGFWPAEIAGCYCQGGKKGVVGVGLRIWDSCLPPAAK